MRIESQTPDDFKSESIYISDKNTKTTSSIIDVLQKESENIVNKKIEKENVSPQK